MIIAKEFKKASLVLMLLFFSQAGISQADTMSFQAEVTPQIFDKVKKNDYWKQAFSTGKEAQIVFMNISPQTNPNNEIGMETHKFDQIIFVVEGKGKAILGDKETTVKSGDLIFIPQGISHNVVNLNKKKPLKILSVYSSTDIPANVIYKKKSDVTED